MNQKCCKICLTAVVLNRQICLTATTVNKQNLGVESKRRRIVRGKIIL
jgi:hypothetical protein